MIFILNGNEFPLMCNTFGFVPAYRFYAKHKNSQGINNRQFPMLLFSNSSAAINATHSAATVILK